MKYSTYIKPRVRTNIKPRFRLSFFLRRVSKWFFNSISYLIIGLIVVLFVFVIYRFSILTIDMDKVEINGVGSFISFESFKSELSNNLSGKNMLKINEFQIEKDLRDKFLGIKEIHIRKKIPTYIIVDVVERVPSVLVFDSESKIYMVDYDGFVLGEPTDKYKDLPKVKYNKKVETGSFINGNSINLYNNIKSGLENLPLSVTDVVLGDAFATVYLQNNITIYLSNEKEVGNSFDIVYSIIGKFSTEDKKVSKIDLRYDKVIVSYD